MKEISISWEPGRTVTGLVHREASPMFVLSHGAGTDQRHESVAGIARRLADAGHGVMTFDYPYTEAGRRAPDRAPTLLACHRAVTERARDLWGDSPVLGGRSMGGRMATMIAAEGAPIAGVVCLAYPLHPAGKPDRLRIEHLPAVDVPMLFFQGSRDALSRAELFDAHVRPLPGATVVDMDGADHSFRGRGWTSQRVSDLVVERYGAWLGQLS